LIKKPRLLFRSATETQSSRQSTSEAGKVGIVHGVAALATEIGRYDRGPIFLDTGIDVRVIVGGHRDLGAGTDVPAARSSTGRARSAPLGKPGHQIWPECSHRKKEDDQ